MAFACGSDGCSARCPRSHCSTPKRRATATAERIGGDTLALPDFLTPRPASFAPTLDEQLTVVRATPAPTVRRDLLAAHAPGLRVDVMAPKPDVEELVDAAQNFDLIIDLNAPKVRAEPLSLATTAFGGLLREQQPVGGMFGTITDMIRDGTIAGAITQNPVGIGYETVKAAVAPTRIDTHTWLIPVPNAATNGSRMPFSSTSSATKMSPKPTGRITFIRRPPSRPWTSRGRRR